MKYFTDIKVTYDEDAKVGSLTEQEAAIVFKRRLWPGAVIPYTFSRTLGECQSFFDLTK